MQNTANKCLCLFTLAENVMFLIAFTALLFPYMHKNGLVKAIILQQLPLDEAVASVKDEWLTVKWSKFPL